MTEIIQEPYRSLFITSNDERDITIEQLAGIDGIQKIVINKNKLDVLIQQLQYEFDVWNGK